MLSRVVGARNGSAPMSIPYLRIVLAGLLLLIIAINFWSTSRYPDLNDKAVMSGTIQLEDPLSFEVLLPIQPGYPLWQKIAYTTVNWIKTNLNGMIFGVLFGSAFLTLLRYLPKRSFKGRFANSALGMAIGAPLGVCVNCAAPIAKGIYQSGARAETTLSAMMASPTMNIIVLTMLFSIMPFYLAITKIVLSVVVVLLAVPIIVRLLPQDQLTRMTVDESGQACELPSLPVPTREPVPRAMAGFLTDFAKDFWFIVSRTVPLMFLAGFLGAIAATLLPLEELANLPVNILTILGVSLVGVFLPVPIAFDVVIAGTLFNAGLPIAYIMALLFSLGIFSVYSYVIIASTISLRAASLVTVAVVGLSVAAGLGADYYHSWQLEQSIELLLGQ